MKKTKILAALLAASLCAGMIAGCSKGDSKSDRDSDSRTDVEQNDKDRPERVDDKEGRRVPGEEHDHAEHEAEPGSRPGAVQSGPDDDRDQHQRDGEGPEADESAEKLEDDDNGRQQSHPRERAGIDSLLFHIQFLSAVAPVRPDAAQVKYSARGGACQLSFAVDPPPNRRRSAARIAGRISENKTAVMTPATTRSASVGSAAA